MIEQIRSRLNDTAAGDIAAAVSHLDAIAGGTVPDAAAITLELRRIEIALPNDPSAAIGKAKNVVEATAKAVLSDLGQPYSSSGDVPGLVSTAMKALDIDNDSVAEHDRALAKLMTQLSGLAQLLAIYRNKAGDGHAYEELPAGLDLRHGRLAVRAAIAWAAFMLDTLHDRHADMMAAHAFRHSLDRRPRDGQPHPGEETPDRSSSSSLLSSSR
ncbi:hypothetical protein C5E45_19965 [Nocardia nova]|uniref:Abortive infection protein-like C-terminal domain-containing protein n=1 Tax=Nocardia nova TaxID=37330 RepID=A0A2S6AMB4_9NOCA|nr:abortive infection family protein [Nocardia nova]PPJ36333.1 hypothetical protein C5E45_19965 [Nocardia nova]